MKPNRPLSDVAARILRDEAQPHDAVSREKRAQAIGGMIHAMQGQKRRKRVVAGALVVATVIAASIVLAIGSRRPGAEKTVAAAAPATTAMASAPLVRGAASVSHEGNRAAVHDGTALLPGDRIAVHPSSVATIALPDGTQIVLKDEAICTLVAPSPATVFELSAGAFHADVAKLGAAERFVVRTADAEIEVRGTSFDVSRVLPDPSCGEGTTTRVEVREGVVAVRARGQVETLVHANEVWPRDCVAPTASTAAPTTAPTTPAPPPLVPPKSELAAQNDLFERAVTRKRAGDASGAVAGFDQFLVRYPNSHLAQSARAERMKLLRDVDQKRAQAAARDYLERYPTGFARNDAALILAP